MKKGFFSNTYYSGGEKTTKKEIKALMENNEEGFKKWRKSETLNTLGVASLISEIGFITWGFSQDKNSTNRDIALQGALVSLGGVFTFGFWSDSQKKKAIQLYNKEKMASQAFYFKTYPNGLSIVYEF